MQEGNKPSKSVLLEIGALSLGLGVSLVIVFPSFASYIIAFTGIFALVKCGVDYSKFDRLFVGLGLGANDSYPIEKRHSKEDGCTLYEFTLPAGLSSDDFEKKELAISQWLGKEISITYGFKNIFIRVYDQPFKHDYAYAVTAGPGEVPVLIGHDRSGKLIFKDLAEGNEPHMIIAGETGSGKSTVLRAIITNLIVTSRVELYLIDLKYGTEFQLYKDCRKVKGFARTKSEAEAMLEQIRAEVERRYNIFWETGCNDINTYLKRGNHMRRQVLFVDEFANLMYEKNTIRLIEEITSMARACGVYCILTTQRPDAKVLNGRIKVNCATVLGLKTHDETNSRIIIDDAGLEKLAGKGHGLYKHGVEITEVQAPYISPEQAEILLKPYIEVKKAAPRVPKLKDIFEEIGGDNV